MSCPIVPVQSAAADSSASHRNMGGKKRKASEKRAHNPKSKSQKKQNGLQDVPLPEPEEGSDVEVSEEDLQFVQGHAQNLGFLKNLDKKQLDRAVKDRQRKEILAAQAAGAAADQEGSGGSEEDSDQEDYERRPRQTEKVLR